jgi:hypothetical protein
MFLLDGKRLTPGNAFEHNGIQYPANWLNFASLAEKEAIGIEEVAEQSRPNDEYYWVTDNNDGTFSSTAKLLNDREEVDENNNPMWVKVLDNSDPENPQMVDSSVRLVTKGLKSNKVAQIKATANSLLSNTDWMVIRKAERDVAIPSVTVTYRAAVITEATRLETAINAATTVEALITVVQSQNWPKE